MSSPRLRDDHIRAMKNATRTSRLQRAMRPRACVCALFPRRFSDCLPPPRVRAGGRGHREIRREGRDPGQGTCFDRGGCGNVCGERLRGASAGASRADVSRDGSCAEAAPPGMMARGNGGTGLVGALAYLAPELGGLTSTFVYREIAMLRQRGFEVVTFSTLRPREQVFSQEAAAIIQETDYLYDLPKPSVLAAAARALLRRPIRSARALALLLRDMLAAEVPGLPDRVKLAWHFAVGCALARRLERKQARDRKAHV